MSASMIYCQCSYCGTPQRTSAVNKFVVPPLSATTLAPLCTNGCKNVSSTTTNVAPETRIVEREVEPPRQREQLKFGIEKILYGSPEAGNDFA